MKKYILLLLLCSAIGAFAQKADFSGTWKIDTNKTQFGQAPKWVLPKTMKVEQQAAKLILTRISLDQQLQEQPPVTENIPLDGTAFQRKTSDGATVSTVINWLNDHSFKLARTGSQTITETWTLEDDRKTLVINHDVVQANGYTFSIKAYYIKP